MDNTATLSVLYDHQIFAQQVYGGISHYFARLAEALPDCCVQPSIVAPVHINPAIASLPPGIVRGIKISGGRKTLAVGKRLAQRVDPPFVIRARSDVHHETYYSLAPFTRASMPRVTTIHDMIQELLPDQFAGDPVIAAKRASIERADAVICISENTRQDLASIYPWAAGKCVVVHHGVDARTGRKCNTVAPDRPYLLYVGLRGGYKNFAALLHAYAASPLLRSEFNLCCVGPPFSSEETASIERLRVRDTVRACRADDTTLAQLYESATAFIYPSIYEGFGMPPLEAMAAGCPVVCLKSSSLPEVCGDAAVYASSPAAEDIQAAVEMLVTQSGRLEQKRQAGYNRVALFTWEKCARETAQVYRKVA